MKKLILSLFLALGLLALGLALNIRASEATFNNHRDDCKLECVEYGWKFQNWHWVKYCKDYDFVCEEPKDYCETLEGVQKEDEDCPEVTPTPEVTPEPTPVVQRHDEPVGAPTCPDLSPVKAPANAHVVRNGTSATVNAFIPEGNKVQVYYRENSSSDWQHAVRDVPVTNGYVSVEVNNLDANLGYTFGIQAASGCAGGETILAGIIDPPAYGKIFNVSWFELLR